MQPKFGGYSDGVGAELLCPHCGLNGLHHNEVDVFEREEDGTTGLHAHITEHSSITDLSLRGNPSSRRHGLSIGLWCEHCHRKLILTIAQDKGVTLIDFIDSGEVTGEAEV